MTSILPFRSEVEVTSDTPKVVDLEDEESEVVFEALSSDTSRDIYRTLYEDPATASRVAEAVDTSLQNARYHLEKLKDAGLITQVDTWYSSRGNEMAVYAATDSAIIVSGERFRRSDVRSVLESVLTGVVVLAAASLVLHYVIVEQFAERAILLTDETMDAPESEDVIAGNTNESITAIEGSQLGGMDDTLLVEVFSLPPGLLIFAGGLVALVGIGSHWLYNNRRSGE